MYWSLDTRPPTLGEIIAWHEKVARENIEKILAKYEAPRSSLYDDYLFQRTFSSVHTIGSKPIIDMASLARTNPGSSIRAFPHLSDIERQRIAGLQNAGMVAGLSGGSLDLQEQRRRNRQQLAVLSGLYPAGWTDRGAA